MSNASLYTALLKFYTAIFLLFYIHTYLSKSGSWKIKILICNRKAGSIIQQLWWSPIIPFRRRFMAGRTCRKPPCAAISCQVSAAAAAATTPSRSKYC